MGFILRNYSFHGFFHAIIFAESIRNLCLEGNYQPERNLFAVGAFLSVNELLQQVAKR